MSDDETPPKVIDPETQKRIDELEEGLKAARCAFVRAQVAMCYLVDIRAGINVDRTEPVALRRLAQALAVEATYLDIDDAGYPNPEESEE